MSVIHGRDLAFLDMRRMTFRAARRRVEDILALAFALPGDFLHPAAAFGLPHGDHIHLLPHEFVVLGCRDATDADQTPLLAVARNRLAGGFIFIKKLRSVVYNGIT